MNLAEQNQVLNKLKNENKSASFYFLYISYINVTYLLLTAYIKYSITHTHVKKIPINDIEMLWHI